MTNIKKKNNKWYKKNRLPYDSKGYAYEEMRLRLELANMMEAKVEQLHDRNLRLMQQNQDFVRKVNKFIHYHGLHREYLLYLQRGVLTYDMEEEE